MESRKKNYSFNKKKFNNNIIYNFDNIKNKKLDSETFKIFENFNKNKDEMDFFSNSLLTNSIDEEKSNKFKSIKEFSQNSSIISLIRLKNSTAQIKIELFNNNNPIIIEGKNCKEIVNNLNVKLKEDYDNTYDRNLILMVIIKKLKVFNFTDGDDIYTKLMDDIIYN